MKTFSKFSFVTLSLALICLNPALAGENPPAAPSSPASATHSASSGEEQVKPGRNLLHQEDPVVDGPQLLNWPLSRGKKTPSMAEPASNTLYDLHGEFNDCDFAFTTIGNYHMALEELFPKFLASFPKDKPLRNWVYTTTPPVITEQLEAGLIQIGELEQRCPPLATVGRKEVVQKLKEKGVADGEGIPIVRQKGMVILVRKGNPKKIRTVWDLARPGVKFVTGHPFEEPNTYRTYATNLYNIALKDPKPPKGMDADKLMRAIYQSNKPGATPATAKLLVSNWTHHRGIPWSLSYGHGDAAIMIYHLARDAAKNFPDKFEVIPLGGTVEEPQPMPGNQPETFEIVKLKGNWTERQKEAIEKFIAALRSDEFTAMLKKHGLERP